MFNEENVNLTIEQFNFTCDTFTNVMAIKHRLLRSLFSGTYYFTNSNDNLTSEKGIKNLTLMLEYLESLASILQDIEVCTCILHVICVVMQLLVMSCCVIMLIQEISACKQCIVFNSDQYKKIYWNNVNEQEMSVFQKIVGEKWAVKDKLIIEWGNGCSFMC